MSTRLKITKDGLKAWEWDGEEKGKHKIRQKDGKYLLINRKTKEVVKEGDTAEEVEEILWKPKEIDIVWSFLRETCTIEDGVTLGDIYNIIEKDDSLEILVRTWYPLYRDYRNENILDIKEFEVRRSAYLAVGNFRLSTACPIPSLDVAHLPVKLISNVKVYKGDDEIWRYRLPPFYREVGHFYSLLEIIDGIFRGCRNDKKCILREEGLFSDEGMIDDPFPSLMDICDIEDGLTLQDVFNFVEKDEMLKAFIGPYSWCHVDAFHKAAKLPKGKGTILRNLTISKVVGLWIGEYSNLDCYVDFGAQGPIEPDQLETYGENPPDIIDYGVSFTPMAEMADLPIRLKKEVNWFENTGKVETKDQKCKVDYTLLDILDAIYDEISFHGSPEKAQEKLDELKGFMDEIKSGEAKGGRTFHSVDEMRKYLDEEFDEEEEEEE